MNLTKQKGGTVRCTDCNKEMEGRQIVSFSTILPEGEKISSIIDDRCPKCRDDYGVIFDALQNTVDTMDERPVLE